MAATEQNIQEMKETPERIIPSLGYLAYKALGDEPLRNPGFFKTQEAPCPDVIERYVLKDLCHCAGFGKRREAETIFSHYPKLLLTRGKLTDIAKDTYEDITAFEYAVMVKDSHFVRKVVDFLKAYQGEDKTEIVANLLEQFDRYFSAERLAAVNRFIEAFRAWRAAFPNQTWGERNQSLVQDVGETQAKFPAHILQEYCHQTRSFDPTPSFSDQELPKSMDFYNWDKEKKSSLLESSPGVLGGFVLIRGGRRTQPMGGAEGCGVDWEFVQKDCAAVDALDKARTADLLVQREQLALLLNAENSLVPHAITHGTINSI